MELRHLRYLAAVAEFGTFREAGRRLHVSQSAISEQIADLEAEVGGSLLERGQRTRLTPQGAVFLAEAQRTLGSADRALDLARRSFQGEAGSLAIGFFLWGTGGFFASIIREFRKLHPQVQLTLMEMHTWVQMEAFEQGKIDVGFTRPLEPPYDRVLRAELLYNDPVIAVMPRGHRLAVGGKVRVKQLAGERFVMSDRAVSPVLYDSILALCSGAGFSPHLANTSATWAGVLTLVESGEGVALVPSGVRHLRTPGVVFCRLEPETVHVGLSVAWDPRNEGPVVQNFLKLVRANKDRIRKMGIS